MTLTDRQLQAISHALLHVHEPVPVPLQDMPEFVGAYQVVAKEMQARKAQSEMEAMAKRLGAKPAKASDAPPPTNGHAEEPPDLHVVEPTPPEAHS